MFLGFRFGMGVLGVVWLWAAFGLIWCLDQVSCRV